MEVKVNPLATESIPKLLLKFSVPTTLTLMVNYLYNIVDQIFVGQGVGITGIAATNISFPFSIVCTALALLIGDGCAARISLYLGRKEQQKADKCFGNAFLLLILCGLSIVLLGNLFLKELLLLCGATETILPSALQYTRIILFGLPFMIFNVAFTAIIRSDGNPKYTMKAMMIGAVINIILDPIFIFYFHMGVQGAAIATILGQIVSGIICIYYIPRFQNITFQKENMAFDLHTSVKILSLGIPSFITQIATACTQIAMNNIMRYYGTDTIYGSDIALSCYGTMMKVYQIAHAMFVGVSSGTQPINGFNYGAKQYKRVKQTYCTAVIIALVISIIWWFIYQFFPAQIAALFVSNEQEYYISFAVHCYHFYMMAFFIYGIPTVTSSFFQAIGKPAKALIISVCRQILFLIPLSIILSSKYGINGALISAPIADILAFLLAITLILYELNSWKKKELI
ncbi:MATE family efflux transporter [Clostridium sp. MD294]|uniref:MATE family efflux transporter n=1 Tax=Clostridium sp. MD294 TaxID=97138 RepID=UPI0002CC88E8|nr:MATE family efflux transporter [Clostridium sp. MD294]NDO45745.1 MATE family efflux transporter [Clostridium sp. MD294]USF30602.1 Multidrug export protein MepA [Clostridium sp. MD294]